MSGINGYRLKRTFGQDIAIFIALMAGVLRFNKKQCCSGFISFTRTKESRQLWRLLP